MVRSLYRVRQFISALTASVRPQEAEIIRRWLTPAGVSLFYQMPHNDQRHSLNVLYTLQARGNVSPPLMQAALLHDVAKSAGIRLWHRVAVVLLSHFQPGWSAYLASADAGSWRYGFYLYLHHPHIGAMWAEAAGCMPEAVVLIREHQTPSMEGDSVLAAWHRALRAADEEN